MRIAVLADLGHKAEHIGDDLIGLASAKKLQARGFETVILSTDPQESRRLFPEEEIIKTPQVGGERLQAHTIYREAKSLFAVEKQEAPSAVKDQVFSTYASADSSAQTKNDLYAPEQFAYKTPENDYAGLPVMADLAAVAECDGIVVAGGGGLHSDYWWLALERALTGVVASGGGKKPLVVTGGSLGPIILEEDRYYLQELAQAAGACAWRGGQSLATALKLLDSPEKHLLSCDDVTDYAIEALADNSEEKTHILACFAPISPGIDTKRLAGIYARLLDDFAQELKLPVKLISHMGDPSEANSGDMGFARQIKALMQAEAKVEELGDIDTTIAYLKGAKVNITSRFHQGVFGLANQVPTLLLNSNFYTQERQNDLLENYGLDRNWALPVFAFEEETKSRQLVQDFCSCLESFEQSYFQTHNQRLAEHQEKWWDWVAQYLRQADTSKCDAPPFLQSGYAFNTHAALEAPKPPASFIENNRFYHSQLVALNNATQVWLELRYQQDWVKKYQQTLAQYQAELVNHQQRFCRLGMKWADTQARLEDLYWTNRRRAGRLVRAVMRKLAFKR